MENILFVANTEGHLLTIASLIYERYNTSAGYQPYVLQVERTGSPRFQNETAQELLTQKYFEIDPAEKNVKEEIREILNTSFVRVFIFLEQLSLNVYLSNYFKKKGSTICLGPDGTKPYFTVDRMAPRSRLLKTIEIYKYLFERKLFYYRLYFLSWNYAKLEPIDEVWVTYPQKFINREKKKVVGFQILPDSAVARKVIAFFKLDVRDIVKQTSNIIFYANNILYRKETYDAEIEAIRFVQNKFPEVPFYLKYHPGTPPDQLQKFKDLGLICFCNSKPAELYIAALSNSIILGCWSAALLVNNPDCKFYWLHHYLIKSGTMISDLVNLINPAPHIIDVENLDEITF